MKNLLIATTALVATATVAAADVSISGFAGIAATANEAHSDDAFKVQSNIDLFVNASVQTDNGLTFSADVNMEDLSGTNTTDDENGDGDLADDDDTAPAKSAANSVTSVVSVSGAFGSIAFGNTDGALDRVTTEVYRTVGNDYELWYGVVDNDDDQNILRYEYNAGGLRIAMSNSESDNANGVGVSYKHSMGAASVTFGAAIENGDEDDITAASLGFEMGNGLGVRAIYWKGEDAAGATTKDQTDVGVQYSANGLTVAAAYMMDDKADTNNYTVFGEYDLGGGATAFAGTGTRGAAEDTVSTIGVRFNF